MNQFIKKKERDISIYELIWKDFQDTWLCRTVFIYSWTGKALFLKLEKSGYLALTAGQDKDSKIYNVLFKVWNSPGTHYGQFVYWWLSFGRIRQPDLTKWPEGQKHPAENFWLEVFWSIYIWIGGEGEREGEALLPSPLSLCTR